jgi:thioredoxin 1
MPLQTTDDNHFDADVLEAEQLVLVDFTAAWCAPCRIMEPIFEELDAERSDMRVVSLDVDTNPNVTARYGVMAMPTLMVFRGGEPVLKLVGARPKGRLVAELEAAGLGVPVA